MSPRTVLGFGSHGGLVGTVQRALLSVGFDPKGVDEQYGGNTATTVKAFQQAHGLGATGVVDEVTWQALLQQQLPGTDVRSLELTAAFEGHGYSLAVGNFDGAWLTWGIIGFTMKHGEVQEIILAIHDEKQGKALPREATKSGAGGRPACIISAAGGKSRDPAQ